MNERNYIQPENLNKCDNSITPFDLIYNVKKIFRKASFQTKQKGFNGNY